MTATHAGLLLEECFFFFLSLLISTFFGNFPLLSFLLSCRLSSPEVTKNALKTGSRVANTHPSLTPTHTHRHTHRHSLTQAGTHSLVPVTNHLPKLKLKSRLVSPQIPLQLIVNCDMGGRKSKTHTLTHTHMGTISLSSSSILHVRRSPAANEAFDRARTRSHSHTHTPINMSRTHTWPHSHSVERNEMKRRTGRVNVTARNLSMQPAAHAVPLFIRVHELKLCATMTATA